MVKIKWSNVYLFPFTLMLCISLLLIAFVGLQNASADGTLYIADIQGDRSVLDDVVISGVLQDQYHGTSFEIRNDEVHQEFTFYERDEAILTEMNKYSGNTLQIEGLNYSYHLDYVISPKANIKTSVKISEDENGQKYEEKTRTADMVDVYVTINAISYQSKRHKWDRVRFHPGAYIKSDEQDFIVTEKNYYNSEGNMISKSEGSVEMLPHKHTGISVSDNAFVMLDGSIYFTVLSTPDYKGTSGIFKIEKFAGFWMPGETDRTQYGEIKTIESFSLDGQNLTVLGLEAVNQKLVLILLEDGMLKLRSYDPESGRMLDELEVTPLSITELGGTYQGFIMDDRLNISFSRVSGKNEESPESNILMASVRIDDAITLLHLVEGLDLEKGESLLYSMDQIYEVNGKLFAFAYIRQGDEQQRQYPYEILEPKHYFMFVYRDGKLIYKGELVNDSDEDYIADRQKIQMFNNSHGSNYYQYRQISALKVRGR